MKTLSFLLILFFFALRLSAQSNKADSLINLLSSANKDSSKVDLLFQIGDQYENIDIETAKHYIRMGGKLSREINYEAGILKYYKNLAYLYAFQSKFDSVIYYNKLVLDIARQKKDTFNIGISLFNIGVGYRYNSDYESAIQYTLDGVKLLEGKGYTNIESGMYNGLQALYMTLLQYDKAILYGEKSVAIARGLEDKNELITSLINLALSYVELNRIHEAKLLNNEAITLSVQHGNKSMEAAALNNLSDIAEKENEIELIKVYAEKALIINKQINNQYGIMCSKQALSIYYLYKKQYKKSEILASEALKISNEENFLDGKGPLLLQLANIAYASHDFRSGYRYHKEREKVEKELFTESLVQREASMKVKFESEKKDNQIKLQKAKLQKRTFLNYLLIGSAVTLIIIFLLSYRNYKHKKKLQELRISELETDKMLTATEAVLKGEEQERSRLAKDLHDGLGGMLAGIKYSFQTIKGNLIMTPQNQQSFERGMDMLDSSINEMRRVAQNMMPESLVKFGLDTALQDFCKDINLSGALQVSYQSIGLAGYQFEQTTAITIYRIIQELINNTLKHASAKTAIVQITKSGSLLAITVEDDGKGFDPKILDLSKGMGWVSIKHRVDFLKGRLDINSQHGNGTSVHIEVDI